MQDHSMLTQVVIFLAAAVLAVPIAKKLGLGSVIGYLLAGVAIGPFGLALIPSTQEVMHFAEFGVVLLLFLIGLELNPRKLWELRRPILGAGGSQVLFTSLVLAAVGIFAFRADVAVSVVAAMGVALSSTAIALQVLKEKSWLGTPAGSTSFSVLLFQDLAVIPMLALLPLMAAKGMAVDVTAAHDAAATAASAVNHTAPAWMAALKSLAAILIVIVGGRFLTRPIFRIIAKTELREMFTAFSLLLVVGIALLMTSVGLSMALGSFLAGVLLADSEYRHELEIDIEPFKGLLLGLFFVSIGLGIDFAVLRTELWLVLGLVVLVVGTKLLVSYAVGRIFKLGGKESMIFSTVLSQGGEFAFVLFGIATQLTIFSAEVSAILNLVVALSMVTTPFLVILCDRFLRAWCSGDAAARPFDKIENENAPVIIAGYGRFGQMVGRVLHALNVPATILDSDPNQIDLLRKFGWKTFYGDASRLDLLHAAGIEKAKILVVAIDNMETSLRLIEAVRHAYPHVQIVARTRNRPYAYQMKALGVKIVREVAASSVEMAAAVLEELGYMRHEAYRLTRQFYHYDKELLDRAAKHAEDQNMLISLAKQSTEQLTQVMQADKKKFTSSDVTGGWG